MPQPGCLVQGGYSLEHLWNEIIQIDFSHLPREDW
jgi:hypothetical protein